MPLLFWLAIAAIAYVSCFKDDFTKENIDKFVPFLATMTAVILIVGSLLSWLGG